LTDKCAFRCQYRDLALARKLLFLYQFYLGIPVLWSSEYKTRKEKKGD